MIVLSDASQDSFRSFFKWMSQSIAVQSRAVTQTGAGSAIDLSKPLPDGARVLGDDDLPGVDDRLAVFVARCQHSEARGILPSPRS